MVEPSTAGEKTDVAAARSVLEGPHMLGRNSGSQMVQLVKGGTLFSWGLNEWRLGRKGGDNSLPEPAMPELKVSLAAL